MCQSGHIISICVFTIVRSICWWRVATCTLYNCPGLRCLHLGVDCVFLSNYLWLPQSVHSQQSWPRFSQSRVYILVSAVSSICYTSQVYVNFCSSLWPFANITVSVCWLNVFIDSQSHCITTLHHYVTTLPSIDWKTETAVPDHLHILSLPSSFRKFIECHFLYCPYFILWPSQ